MTDPVPPSYGIYTFLSWAVFPSAMVISERYFRGKSPYWLITTILGSITVNILTHVDLSIRAPRQGPELNSQMYYLQYSCLAIHILPGFVLIWWRGTNSGSKQPSFWLKWFHIIFGYLNVVAIALLVLSGHIEVSNEIRIIYGVFLLIGASLLGLFEYGWWHNWFSKMSYIRSQVPYTLDTLLKQVDQGKPYLCIDNRIIDIGTWAMHHPGGKYAIEKNFGSDIGRYFYGVYKIDNNFRAYKHSEYAANIFKHSVVGEVKENAILKTKMLRFQEGVVAADLTGWTLLNRTPVTSLIKRIELTKQGVERQIFLHDTTIWGKFIKISGVTDWGATVTRFYTFSQALTNESIEVHDKLVEAFETRDDYDYSAKLDPRRHVPACYVIYPKLYDYGHAFSRFLHKGETDKFEIDGPQGLGLGLDGSSNGSYLAITAGTGLLPFMDIVLYLFRRNLKIYGAAINKDFEGIKYEPMDLLGKDFKFELWGNFRKSEEVIGLKYLLAAAKLSEVSGANNFVLNLRISEEDGSPRWGQDYFAKKLGDKKFKKAFIRGPQEFNWAVEEMLERCGAGVVDKIIHL